MAYFSISLQDVFGSKSRFIDLCVGGLTNGLFLATSSRASMKILGDLSLPYLVFAYQLTDVVNVTMQLPNVAVLDNCKSAYNDGVKCQVRCLWGQVGTPILVNANLAGVGELCW